MRTASPTWRWTARRRSPSSSPSRCGTYALGKPAEARTFRFYADDPASAVAALRAGGPSAGTDRTSHTSDSDSVSRTRSR
ncbi:hypothetical protein [Streptomyces sp. F001]|uniref:hypothetical protein n=1 Tax=Streptomyces sp. F001 TaxID=1510026 RepID=UPI001F0D5021|nr:hypothetical protein [Streptomyces sp. F001]